MDISVVVYYNLIKTTWYWSIVHILIVSLVFPQLDVEDDRDDVVEEEEDDEVTVTADTSTTNKSKKRKKKKKKPRSDEPKLNMVKYSLYCRYLY